ncbi:hypothetical protein EG329_004249 [Mollisiaceae sp. DMI_Dod_QoI]|nr:hypothetical protein EG329_004249 [Helotiales sp. DMI_Dod_QoI]
MDKEEYFRQLYALNDSSDEEQDTNNAREVIKQSAQTLSASFPTPSQSSPGRRSQPSKTPRRVPGIHRTTSAPVSSTSVRRETPRLVRKPSKVHHDIATPDLNQTFSTGSPPSSMTPAPERSASTPNLTFGPNLLLQPSAGIKTMLNKGHEPLIKKRKRKEEPLKSVPEDKHIFAGKTFFFIPNSDVSRLRRARITNARSYGAVWATEWTPHVSHVIVDKELKYEHVMSFLKPLMKADSIPSNVILVNEEYPIDCLQYGTLVDATQGRYAVERDQSVPNSNLQSINPRTTLQVQEPKSKKNQETPEENTQRSEISAQIPSIQGHPSSFPEMWLPPTEAERSMVAESPRERSQILDISFGQNSELDQMIEETRKMGFLPLDDDEEEDRSSSSEGDPDTDHDGSSEEERRFRDRKKRRHKKKGTPDQANLSCMVGGTGVIEENNPNRNTIDILQRMADYYTRINDGWRSYAYQKGIGTLKRLSVKVIDFEQAIELPHIGKSLAAKIEEIVLTGRLRKLENAELEPEDYILQLFLKVYGVGPAEAGKFIKAGYKSLDDLRTNAHLTKGQRIGLEHYEDFNTRIPRNEMTTLGDIVKKAAKLIDPEVEVIISGSYRRGAATSGDIDFIFTKPGTDRIQDLFSFLNSLVDHLTNSGFLTAPLATPGHRPDSGSKWHGACVLPGNPIWRRIDFLLVPETELGAALIYFTGDDIFNRSIRWLAGKKGYSLNQKGLYKDVMRGPGRKKITDGVLVEGRDERRIFEKLGVPWKKPEHRICH